MRKIKWNSLLKIAVTIFALYLCMMYWPYISYAIGVVAGSIVPLIIGGIVAYVINIPMNFFESLLFGITKHKFTKAIKRPTCILLAVFCVALIISFVMTLVIPELIIAIKIVIALVVEQLRALESVPEIYKLIPKDVLDGLTNINWENTVKQAVDMLVTGIGGTVNIIFSTVSSVFTSAFNVLLSVVFSLYLLISKEKIAKQLSKVLDTYFKNDKTSYLYHVVSTLDNTFRLFIVGQCSEALIIGVLCTIGMYIFRLPHAMATGALVGLTALIPVAGAWIGALVGALLILTVSPVKALLFLVYIVILQQLENNLIYPKVVGTSTGLPGIWVLAAITIGGGALGIGGMLISVPITATVYKLLREDVAKRNEKAVVSVVKEHDEEEKDDDVHEA